MKANVPWETSFCKFEKYEFNFLKFSILNSQLFYSEAYSLFARRFWLSISDWLARVFMIPETRRVSDRPNLATF